MDSVTANSGEIVNFILSFNEILFMGWLLGILEALLVKKTKIDWSFATFNLILTVCFWFITERFVKIIDPVSTWGQMGLAVTFLIVGYGAYKFFQLMIRFGIPAIGKGFRGFFGMFAGQISKLPEEKEQENNIPGN